MNLKDYKNEYEILSNKKNLTSEKAKLSVQQDGLALRYVNEQTEEICKLAVQQNGDALKYVDSKFFD